MSGRALRSCKHRALAKRVLLGPIDENTALVGGPAFADGKRQSHNNNDTSSSASNSDLQGFDGANEAHVLSFIIDVEKELSKRKLSMDAETENLCLQLETIKQSSFVKLNKAVRKMTVKHLLEQYGGDLDASCQALLLSQQSNNNAHATQSSSDDKIIGKADEYGRPLRTPARVKASSFMGNRTPATVRVAKRGEILFSENGSPIAMDGSSGNNTSHDVILSVKKARGGATTTPSSVICINVGQHDINIDLSNPDDISNLDPEQRALALLQLKSFQDQVGDLMGRFAKNL